MNFWMFFLAVSMVCRAEVIDRIAVIVGTSVISESQVLREIRLTAFLNGEALDFSAASKRKTADRLVEQRLIQIENDASLYPPPTEDAVNQALQDVKSRMVTPMRYEEELRRAGVTEAEVKAHLQRQLMTLRFLDLRFRPGIQIGDAEVEAYFGQRVAPDLKKAHPGVEPSVGDYRQQIEQVLIGERVDKASDTWLKQAREHTRIEFRANVFSPDETPREATK